MSQSSTLHTELRTETSINNCSSTDWLVTSSPGSEYVAGLWYMAVPGPDPNLVTLYWMDLANYYACLAMITFGGPTNCVMPTYPPSVPYVISTPGSKTLSYDLSWKQSDYDALPQNPSCDPPSSNTSPSSQVLSSCPPGYGCTLPSPTFPNPEQHISGPTSTDHNEPETSSMPGQKDFAMPPGLPIPLQAGTSAFIPGSLTQPTSLNVGRVNMWDSVVNVYCKSEIVSCTCAYTS